MREFGKLGSTIWRSRKFRALPDWRARLAYLYLQSSPHGNSAGAYVCPAELVALDLVDLDVAGAVASLIALHDVGLIRYDPDEGMIQIRGFFRMNSPTSRKYLAGPLRILPALPRSPCRDAAAAELMINLAERAATWRDEIKATPERSKVLADPIDAFTTAAVALSRDYDVAGFIEPQEIEPRAIRWIQAYTDIPIDSPIDSPTDTPMGRAILQETETETATRRRRDGDDTATVPILRGDAQPFGSAADRLAAKVAAFRRDAEG